ncbi:MAG: segregation and condensation protein A [Solirubrobacteraceae bacterium]|nr:MAG: chromosome segregation protein ScpA [Solirubrobacterales bacterium]
MQVAELELDLDVFAGPFDLLLTLVLREEIDLLEVDLAQVVLAYLDHLEARGELELEPATEFLVLIAAVLELKSRLMLPRAEIEELLGELDASDAAEQLLSRLLESQRYRGAARHLAERLVRERGYRFRSAPVPPELRRARLQSAVAVYESSRLTRALGELLLQPPAIELRHLVGTRVSLADRLGHLRALLRRGRFGFEEAVAGADRVTVAVTLFALLELYKQGEATWHQQECFGPIEVVAAERVADGAGGSQAADSEARGAAA